MTTPELTLVLPLRSKETLTAEQFYDYWLNAHVTLPARFPGISTIWLHAVDFAASTLPGVEGISSTPPAREAFHGVPEAVFPTFDDLADFQAHAGVQMEDGANFLADMLGYASLGDHSATLVDRTDLPAPDGSDTLVRHLVFLRAADTADIDTFRAAIDADVVRPLAAHPDVLKLRRHLFEPLDLTLDHPGVTMTKPIELQYQAAIELVTADHAALDRLVGSSAWTEATAAVSRRCSAFHAARVTRCITTKHDGAITLAGARGVLVADLLRDLHADSQLDDAVTELFLPDAVAERDPVLGRAAQPA